MFCFNEIYTDVIYKVSSFALNHVKEQLKNSILIPYTGKFLTTMGIPCIHFIQWRLANFGKLLKADFHCQWWIQDDAVTNENGTQNVTESLVGFDRFLQLLQSKFDESSASLKINLFSKVALLVEQPIVLDPVCGKPLLF